MHLWFLISVKDRGISEIVEDYRPGEENRGEWEQFRREHLGPGHALRLCQAVGQ
jgi:hypothetical protein